MSPTCFQLKAHPATPPNPAIEIHGRIQRRQNILTLRFELRDSLNTVQIEPPAAEARRTHGLWERTCFECFFAASDSPGYWEINLSPAGHWNIYRFDDYRQGMREEGAFQILPVTCAAHGSTLRVVCDVDLTPIVAPLQPIQVGISAAILTASDSSYWALTHSSPRPDFHDRRGFIIVLAGR
ncbi:MAG: DOMON-like domain-containing protein [Desulfobacteraceae bacterium]|nr:DOMON-like domain-containing protein [Desulfobacteraceae bacterium]